MEQQSASLDRPGLPSGSPVPPGQEGKILPAWAGWFILLCLLASSLPFLILPYFSYPSSDDFYTIYMSKQLGVWGSIRDSYFSWSGRFASSGILSATLADDSAIARYPYILWTGLAVILASLCFAGLAMRKWISSPAWLVILPLCCLTLSRMPSPGQGFYWFTGMGSYTLPAAFFLIKWAAMALAWSNPGKAWRWPAIVAACLVGVISSGSNESLAALDLALSFCAWVAVAWMPEVWWSRKERGVFNLFLPTLLISAIVAAVVVLAPGNSIRAGVFTHHYSRLVVPFLALRHAAFCLTNWLTDPAILLASLAFLAFRRQAGWRANLPAAWKIAVVGVAAVFILVFPAYWAMEKSPPMRSIDQIYPLFLCLWVLCLHALPASWDISMPRSAKAATMVFLGLALVLQGNAQNAWKEATSVGRKHLAFIKKRDAAIRMEVSAGTRELAIPAPEKPVKVLYLDDITSNPADWRNVYLAKYYGLEKIWLKADGPDVEVKE